jgi:hypothetical protein
MHGACFLLAAIHAVSCRYRLSPLIALLRGAPVDQAEVHRCTLHMLDFKQCIVSRSCPCHLPSAGSRGGVRPEHVDVCHSILHRCFDSWL